MARLRAAAIAYARRGIRVFPLRPRGKEPLGEAAPHGVKDASKDPEEVAAWWEAHPDANIGIATGAESSTWALDVDGDRGAATLRALEIEHGDLPLTVSQNTANGVHYLFAWPLDGPVTNSAGKIGPGIDVRGEGGYIVAAPSVHPSGRRYTWTPGRTAFLPAPAWLLDLVRKKKPHSQQHDAKFDPGTISDNYGRAAIMGEYAKVAGAKEGGRNQALNTAAFALGQLLADGLVKRADVEAALIAAASENGYLGEEGLPHVQSVIASGIEAGLANPREKKPESKRKGPTPRPHLRVVRQEKEAADEDEEDAPGDSEPQPEFAWNSKGELRAGSLRNAILLLKSDTALRGLFALDDHRGLEVTTRRPPWTLNGHPAQFAPAPLSDADIAGF
jgi:hypothetical protein